MYNHQCWIATVQNSFSENSYFCSTPLAWLLHLILMYKCQKPISRIIFWPKKSNFKETIQSYSRKKVLFKYTRNPWNITDNELVTVLAHSFTKNGTHLKNFLGLYLNLNAYIVQSFLKILKSNRQFTLYWFAAKLLHFNTKEMVSFKIAKAK